MTPVDGWPAARGAAGPENAVLVVPGVRDFDAAARGPVSTSSAICSTRPTRHLPTSSPGCAEAARTGCGDDPAAHQGGDARGCGGRAGGGWHRVDGFAGHASPTRWWRRVTSQTGPRRSPDYSPTADRPTSPGTRRRPRRPCGWCGCRRVSVLAHPWGRGSRRVLDSPTIAALAKNGLAGIEVDHEDHDLADRAALRQIARAHRPVGHRIERLSRHGQGQTLGVNTTDPAEFERLLDLAHAAAAAAGRDVPQLGVA